MKTYKEFLAEQSNTLSADANEILMGLELVGGKWSLFDKGKMVLANLLKRKKQISDYDAQEGRAKAMAVILLSWAKKVGYKGKVVRSWWTARPGTMTAAVGRPVDQKKNPTDILVQFSDGTFLGVSAKSTKGKGDIGFKNPGLGTIERDLGVSLKHHPDGAIRSAVLRFKLPSSAKKRKAAIRANPEVNAKTIEMGETVLLMIRDDMFKALKRLDNDAIRLYIIDGWMDAGTSFPPYVKVTGHGNKPPYSAKLDDPLKNDKVAALSRGQIKVVKVGNTAIGVLANGKRLLKMRVKWESEKLASSVKFSGDPWK